MDCGDWERMQIANWVSGVCVCGESEVSFFVVVVVVEDERVS